MLFEELYDKLIDLDTYLKKEERMMGLTITAQFNQKFKRKRDQSNNNFNKRSNKMPLGHIDNTQSYHPPLC